jgi:lipopolysaccharide export system protein LptA
MLLLAATAAAQAPAAAPVPVAEPAPSAAAAAAATDPLRPTGPVTVSADRAEWQEGGLMRYSGNVMLTSETLQLSGQSLELRQLDSGRYQAKVTGTPARMSHAAANAQGQPQPAITATARTLNYDSEIGVVEVMGEARMARGGDEITGEHIRYNVPQRRIEAAGGNGSQVRIVIQPPADKPAGNQP